MSPGPAVLPELPDLPTPKPSPSKLDLTPRKDAPSLSSLTKRPPSLVKSPSWPKSATLTVGRKKSLSQVCLFISCRETEQFVYVRTCMLVCVSVFIDIQCSCTRARAHTHMHTHLHTAHTHARMHTPHAHTHAHTHTHTYVLTHVHGVYDVFFLLLWNFSAVSNEGQQQQERRRRECKREHFTEGERREADGVCERERVGGSAHAHIRTYTHVC